MKSIRAKFSVFLILAMGFVLLLSDLFLYRELRRMYLHQIIEEQSTIASSNQMGIEYFLRSIDQSFQFMIADRLVGETLSRDFDGDSIDALEWNLARTEVRSQFFHSTTVQTNTDGYSYRSMLFLADYISLASFYETTTMTSNVDNNRDALSNVYSNELVKNEEWYRTTVDLNRALHIFIDDASGQLCFSRSVQNLYYSGPYPQYGIGVMVTQVNPGQLGEFFRFSKITPHTQVLLVNRFGDVLYETNRPPDAPLPELGEWGHIKTQEGVRIQYEGETYISNLQNLNWGLTLCFLTPYSDLNEQLAHFQQFFVAAALLTVAAVAGGIYFVTSRITHPIRALSTTMKNIGDTRQLRPADFASKRRDEIGDLYRSFGQMVDDVNGLIGEVAEQTALQKEAELKALQSQINPHFLYNAMDSVNWMALANGQDGIADMVTQIAAIMRYAISKPDELVTVADEIKNVRHYAQIQNIRYAGRIHLDIAVDDRCAGFPMPKLMLQPLVENSILHGIADSQNELRIQIAAGWEGADFLLTETDDGRGANVGQLNEYLDGKDNGLPVRGGFGIRSVNDRLLLKFAGAARLYYQNLDNGRLQAVIRVADAGRFISQSRPKAAPVPEKCPLLPTKKP